MTRNLLALGAVAVLSACSSGGTSPVVSVIKEVILPTKTDDVPAPSAGSTLTREKIDAYGLALIRARIEGEDVSNLLTGTALNGRYVTYISSFRQNITMLGSLVTGTRGLGGDLLAVRNDANDPVAYLTPAADWPATLTRDYMFPGVGPSGETVSVNCTIQSQGETTLTLVELTYDVTRFSETCAGDGVEFTNTYLADTETGQVWQTLQWVGENLGYLNIDVLEPLTI